jgi:hypothetical protein
VKVQCDQGFWPGIVMALRMEISVAPSRSSSSWSSMANDFLASALSQNRFLLVPIVADLGRDL